jgi:hypothetical protein
LRRRIRKLAHAWRGSAQLHLGLIPWEGWTKITNENAINHIACLRMAASGDCNDDSSAVAVPPD